MELIFDTNVLVSAALLKNSVSDLSFRKALMFGNILFTGETLVELKKTLNKSKFNKYITTKDKYAFINRIIKIAKFIDVIHSVTECRDPKDNIYLELGLSGNADVIITGDKDLLVLNPFRDIPIIKPKDFLENY